MSDQNVEEPEQPEVEEEVSGLPDAPPANAPSPAVLPSEENAETAHSPVEGETHHDPSRSAQPSDRSGLEMDELVQEIAEGKWGNGQERRNRLSAAGYDHREVQEALNERMNRGRNG